MNLGSAVKCALNHNPNLKPSITTLSILDTHLSKCRNSTQFHQILSQTITTTLIKDTYAASRILKFTTAAPFINLDLSRKIFNLIENPNGFICNTMMKSYLQTNFTQKVMNLYKVMLSCCIAPDNYTYPILIQACGFRLSVLEGKQVHVHVLKMGFCWDVYVKNTLMNFYSVCGDMRFARQVFDESPVLDSVSWNTILAGYVQMGELDEAKEIYRRMPVKNVIASNSMIVLFGKLGNVSEACELFDTMPERDMVSWSALISCYEQNELYPKAVAVFKEMMDKGIMLDEVVLISVFSACSHLNEVEEGRQIHGLALKIGFDSYINLQNACIHMYDQCGDIASVEKLFNFSYKLDQVSWNSMISMYMKAGVTDVAFLLFDSIPEKDNVSWSAMISGYAQRSHLLETLALFEEMLQTDVRPDETTLVSVVSVCADKAALDDGKRVHSYVRKNNLKINGILGTTLINMYMKCGCVEDALQVFHDIDEKGVSAWNAVIRGLATNGLAKRALEILSEMKTSGVIPNEITFIGILTGCSHTGLVYEGRYYFDLMVREHKIEPNLKHYGCMVDLYGRAGLLNDAEEVINHMPMEPDIPTWVALHNACVKHCDYERGKRVGRKLLQLQPDVELLLDLSNKYAAIGDWDYVIEIRRGMRGQKVAKTPGCSSILS